MSEELVFYTNPMSRGRIVRWMLEEIGQPYRTVLLEYGTGLKDPAYLAINPMGKVPSLTHGGAVVTECAAICTYLADAFPQAGLAPPPGEAGRAPYYRWMFFAAGPVEAAVTSRALGHDVPADKEGMAGFGSFSRTMDTLETAVAGDGFILGAQFSAVDVYLGSQIGWGLRFGRIDKRPAFERYVARIYDRPAAKRAASIDDALIPKPAA